MKLNVEEIKEIIPHRYPFLFVDSIEELEPGKRAVGKKNVSANEEVFNGHFPNYNVFPGCLTLEACAQTGAVALLSLDEYKGKLAFLPVWRNAAGNVRCGRAIPSLWKSNCSPSAEESEKEKPLRL